MTDRDLPEGVMSLMAQVRSLHEALMAFDQAAARALGVHRTDLQCLLMLEHGPVRAGLVAEEAGLTSGSTTALLDRLEKRGLARRRRAADDRRTVEVDLTPRGRKRIGAIYRALFETFVARACTHDDLAASTSLLSDLVDGCRQAKDALDQSARSRR